MKFYKTIVSCAILAVSVFAAYLNPACIQASESSKLQYKGDYLIYGKYEQDGNLKNGAEPIEWLTVDIGDKIMLISRYVLSSSHGFQYHWNDSEMRKWLNGDFYNKAFTKEEKSKILSTDIYAKPETITLSCLYGEKTNVTILNEPAVKDKVFILTWRGVEGNLIGKEKDAIYTKYAKQEYKTEQDKLGGQLDIDVYFKMQSYAVRNTVVNNSFNMGETELVYTTNYSNTDSGYGCYMYGVASPGVGIRPALFISK